MDIEKILAISAAVCVLTLIAGPTACTMQRNALQAEMVKGGADPLAVNCMTESFSQRTTCDELARRGSK